MTPFQKKPKPSKRVSRVSRAAGNARLRVGISACLYGQRLRYDGGHKRFPGLRDPCFKEIEWIPVCPEVECGLPVPREPMHLERDGERLRLVTVESRKDCTERLLSHVDERLEQLSRMNLAGFVFKSRSPSCGLRGIPIHGPDGEIRADDGIGLFAKAFVDRLALPAEEEVDLADARARLGFLRRLRKSRR